MKKIETIGSHGRSLICGLWISVASMVLYAVPAAVFAASLLYTVSVNSSSANPSPVFGSITGAMIFMPQGIGFEHESLRLTITPLLLTFLMILSIKTIARKNEMNRVSFCAGLAAWISETFFAVSAAPLKIIDSNASVLWKAALIFCLGFFSAKISDRRKDKSKISLYIKILAKIQQNTNRNLRRAIQYGMRICTAVIAVYILAGTITAAVWIFKGLPDAADICDKINMPVPVRLFAFAVGLFWFPVYSVWAISWISGAGFSIGTAGSFTLWSSNADGLPLVPAFAILPSSVENPVLRQFLMLLPAAAAFIIGLYILVSPKHYDIFRFSGRPKPELNFRSLFKEFGYPFMAVCFGAVLAVLFCALFCWISYGSIGQNNFRSVGAAPSEAVKMIGKAVSRGLFCAWIFTAAASYVFYLVSEKKSDSEKTGFKKQEHKEIDFIAESAEKPDHSKKDPKQKKIPRKASSADCKPVKNKTVQSSQTEN